MLFIVKPHDKKDGLFFRLTKPLSSETSHLTNRCIPFPPASDDTICVISSLNWLQHSPVLLFQFLQLHPTLLPPPAPVSAKQQRANSSFTNTLFGEEEHQPPLYFPLGRGIRALAHALGVLDTLPSSGIYLQEDKRYQRSIFVLVCLRDSC